MGKNWLIRTRSNHILGPISKEKVLELLQNGSIKPDDEVCSGNGYWFFIREEDLVARFLLGREQQSFNPISEAKDVLTTNERSGASAEEDITMVGGFDLKRLNEKTPPAGTVVKNLDLNEATKPAAAVKKKSDHVGPLPSYSKNKELPPRPVKPKGPKAQLKKQNYLQYLAVLCFLILLAALFYRKSLLRYLSASVLIPTAHAQETAPAEKKKSLNGA